MKTETRRGYWLSVLVLGCGPIVPRTDAGADGIGPGEAFTDTLDPSTGTEGLQTGHGSDSGGGDDDDIDPTTIHDVSDIFPEEGCTAVDLLFVIDNSGSMGAYQEALGLALTKFAHTLEATLPPGTDVHVGVTSTEMGYSSAGNTIVNNGTCEFIGDGGAPNEAFYVPPDVHDTARNGAQGRLFDPGDGQTFFQYVTGGTLEELQEIEHWFDRAVNIGEGGSNIEMAAAPAGWVAAPANAATNAGFIRDEGAVLVVLFLQDEPDQTPAMIDGEPAGTKMLEMLASAKTQCGGTECIVTGGFLNAQACSADGNLPLDDFLAGAGKAPVVTPLPPMGFGGVDAEAAANEMNEMLSNTLAEVIEGTCSDLEPEG